MNVEQSLRLIAGGFVAASVLLGMYVHPNFLWFTLFVGLNLFQSAFTGWCPMMAILRKAGGAPREADLGKLTLEDEWEVAKLLAAFPARVRAAGDVVAAPAKMEAMYQPERHGFSGGQRLKSAANP